ncbi:MAG: UbiA family prenyltransferase, partial [Verrucomicrobiota bacterium]
MLRTLLILGRISNLPTVWTNVLVGWFLCGGNWSMALLMVISAVSLLYIAGMTLNDAFDAAWDREHAPERPIPAGDISRKAVAILGICQLLAGYGLIAVFDQGLIWGGALVLSILAYNWLHKRFAA